eukprot:1589311-Rhodomonas_salina.2
MLWISLGHYTANARRDATRVRSRGSPGDSLCLKDCCSMTREVSSGREQAHQEIQGGTCATSIHLTPVGAGEGERECSSRTPRP